MKTIGVITNIEKDIDFKYTKQLIEAILSRGGNVKLPERLTKESECDFEGFDESSVINNSDVIICLGGDGTFLKVARKAFDKDIPILGINLGTLGFLTEIEKSEIDIAVDRLMSGNFEIEERMMLECVIRSGDGIISKDIALNDVVISRAALSRILHLNTYINNVFAEAFPGDGLIVSSPTGSTAYSLSAGGPIVEPDVDLIIVTPICPHILNSRPFITTGDRVVKVVVDENYCHDAMVTVDGQAGYGIKGGDSVEIRKSGKPVKVIRMNNRNYFSILRNKIFDRGESMRKDEI